MNEIVIALISAIFGGVGIELIRRFFSKREKERKNDVEVRVKEIDDASKIRTELWDQVQELWNRVHKLEQELTEERSKYLKLQADYDSLQTRYVYLQVDLAQLRRQVSLHDKEE